MRTSYTYATIASLALVLVATPVFAEETTTTTTDTTTTAVTTPAPVSTTVAPVKKTLEEHLAEWRAKGIGKKAGTTAQVREKRALGTKLQNVDAPCVQKAIDTREVTMQKAWTTMNTSISDALMTRQKALYDAWGLSDVTARATALKSAWNAWKDAHKSIFKALKTERTTAWSTYKTTMKNECKVSVPAEDKTLTGVSDAVTI